MTLRVVALVAALVAAPSAGARQAAPAAPPIPPALIEQFVAAPADDARERLLVDSPTIATGEFRMAVQRFAIQQNGVGDRVTAIRAYETAVWLARRFPNPRAESAGLIGLGLVYGQSGDYAAAAPILLQALTLAESTGDTELIASAANNLGNVYRRRGEPDLALAQFERSFTLLETAGRAELAARALNNIGVVYQQQSNSRAALDYYLRSLALKEKFAAPDELVTTLVNIGEIYSLQNNGPLAIVYSRRALDIAERSGNVRLLVSALNNVGFTELNDGNLAEAEAAFSRGLPLAEQSGAMSLVAEALSNLGTVAIKRRQWDLARQRLDRARGLLQDSGERIGEGEALAELARLDLEQGRTVDATAKLARARELLSAAGTPISLGEVHYMEGQLHVRQGRLAEGIESFEHAIQLNERARDLAAGGTEDRLRYFEGREQAYYGLADAYASAHRAVEAFATVERARARGLLDVLAGGKSGAALLTAEEQQRQHDLDVALLSLTTRIETERTRPGVGPSPVPDLETELAQVRRTRDAFSLGLDQSHPDLRFVRGEAPIVSPGDLVAALPGRTALVEFSTGEKGSWVFFVAGGRGVPAVTVLPLKATAGQLDRMAATFAHQVATRDLGFMSTARGLYAALLGPIDARLAGIDHLIVVPSGALWEVPFQALQTPRHHYLVEERAVSYAPSASALSQLYARRRPAPVSPRVVAFGDPRAASSPASKGPLEPGLPNAAREARAVAAFYGEGRAVAAVAEDASEARFRQIAPGADIVHIATHGVIDNTSPLYSYLELAGTRGAGPDGDGRLEGREILDLRLGADLVVLSACETARGHISSGEGVLGLSWAIFAAGASAAAVSLWPVDSASTTDLMLAFHRDRQQRRTGPAPNAQAMRTAQRSLLAKPEYRHPFYWAGFVIIGVP
ncbi:MAG: CHAT domain-containing protein [Vicinamibacterales bacterium]